MVPGHAGVLGENGRDVDVSDPVEFALWSCEKFAG